MGRKPIDDKPMTEAERQRKRRETLKQKNLFPFYVLGKNGFFDERVRIASAVKQLAKDERLPDEVLSLIIEEAVNTPSVKRRVDRLYIKKRIANFLNQKSEGEDL